jgi:iron(III) transport system substrate-binding protein
MPTSVVVMAAAPHPEPARRLVDYLLSADVEKRMAEAAAHIPLSRDVAPPAGWKGIASIDAMPVDYAQVADEVERIEPWLRTWAGL